MPYIGKQPANVPVTADDIPDNSITSAKILDGVITIADIANDAVTEDKLANSINTAIAANTAKTGITSGQASAITANTAKTGITSGQASAITANTAKVTNSTSASDLSSGTLPMARLSGTLPALNGASLTSVNAINGGKKNIIINGAMNVAQRGTSVTGVGNGDNGYHTCDRWQFVESGSGSSVFTLTQSTDAPSGFGNSMKLACTTTESALAANEQLRLRYNIEGQDLQQLKKGTSEAESFTLSFWVKSYTTGVAIVNFYAASRHIAAPYTINSSATWEKKTITFSGDSTGVIPNDNAAGLEIWFQLYAGSQYTSGTLATSWAAYNEANAAVGQVVNIASSTSNYFQITGVQLELGSTATDFEHRTYYEELTACQRYYEKIIGTNYHPIGVGAQLTTTTSWFNIQWRNKKRIEGGTITFSNLIASYRIAVDATISSINYAGGGTYGVQMKMTHASLGSIGRAIMLNGTYGTTVSFLALDVEL